MVHSEFMLFGALSMTAVTSVAAVIDVRSGRIPNLLTGTFALFALIVHAINGPADVLVTFALMVAVFAVGTLAHVMRALGGGDVKLLAGCAGVVGPTHVLTLFCCITIAGGGLALFSAARSGRLRTLFGSTALVMMGHEPVERTHVPYGVAIAIGSLAYTALCFFSLLNRGTL